jgi:hypothetical protein
MQNNTTTKHLINNIMEIFAMTFIALPIWLVAIELSKLNKFLKNK